MKGGARVRRAQAHEHGSASHLPVQGAEVMKAQRRHRRHRWPSLAWAGLTVVGLLAAGPRSALAQAPASPIVAATQVITADGSAPPPAATLAAPTASEVVPAGCSSCAGGLL